MIEGTLALLIDVSTGENPWREATFTMKLRAVRFLTHEQTVRGTDHYDDGAYNNLYLTVYGGTLNGQRQVYHNYKVEWQDVYTLDLERAKEIVKLGERAHRRYAKHVQEFGYPRSFGQYIAIMCKALDITCVVDQKTNGGTFWNGSRYRTMNPGEALGVIDSYCREWELAGQEAGAT